ncbi:Chaperone YajL [Heracleum sosnowskyi]|uniref:Chaperone YajL n=1 Tax=Heracleum sosnowskyi TaxID=360622 RepID=A0AAD8J4F8_9APIA|nr:Chaperone YajL [Heracleum sosnowskyi]
MIKRHSPLSFLPWHTPPKQYLSPKPSFLTPPKRNSFSLSVMAKEVLVPIGNGTEPIEATMIIDILRRAEANVTVASVEKQLLIHACHGVNIVADAFIDDCANTTFHLIVLPGGLPGASTLKECATLESIVKKQAAEGRLYAAICASPAVAFGSWGLLKGLKATCYPSFMEQLSSTATTVESRVQQDGNAITSRGPGTTMEFSVALVEQLFGKDKADSVKGPLVMRSNPGDEYTIAELNTVEWVSDDPPKVLVPIANGSEEMETISIVDVLRRAKAEVIVASVEDTKETVGSRKVKIVSDMLLNEASKLSYDLIVLPGGLPGAKKFASSETLVEMLKKQKSSNKPYGAICASPALVLEPHGLLEGKKATAFPSLCEKLSDQTETDNRIVVDGNVITSKGPGSSLEFSLAIVEKLFGRRKALELAKTMLV